MNARAVSPIIGAMAEALKDQFGPEVVRRIAASIVAVQPSFPARAFTDDALAGYEALELMARVRRIAQALHRHLPADFEEATGILLASARAVQGASQGWSAFTWLPHTFFVSLYGLDEAHFEASMRAQHALTQLCTAEFSLRAFLERHPRRCFERLREWARDDSEHVRRLVSEGTRPRLPWAPRLRALQRDPAPVLELLELLKDDPSEYVRRSVANNLNDIGKDHPELLLDVCGRWLAEAPAPRRALVRHALRSLTKKGDPRALALLGFGAGGRVAVEAAEIAPARLRIGERLRVSFELVGKGGAQGDGAAEVLVDLRVHYAKADGKARPRVFRLGSVQLAAGERRRLARTLSLRQMSTRTHHPGVHEVEALLNGAVVPLGRFELLPEHRPHRPRVSQPV